MEKSMSTCLEVRKKTKYTKHTKHAKDLDTEIASLAFTLRKLWSGLRSLWRNSPKTSSSTAVQALKDKMKRRLPEDDQDGILRVVTMGNLRTYTSLNTLVHSLAHYVSVPLETKHLMIIVSLDQDSQSLQVDSQPIDDGDMIKDMLENLNTPADSNKAMFGDSQNPGDPESDSPTTPTPSSLPKPSPPSPHTPPRMDWADNIYSKKARRSPDTEDTIPLDSPWETPGIRREDPKLRDESLQALAGPKSWGPLESQDVDDESVSPFNIDPKEIFGSEDEAQSEGHESESQDEDPALVPQLNTCLLLYPFVTISPKDSQKNILQNA